MKKLSYKIFLPIMLLITATVVSIEAAQDPTHIHVNVTLTDYVKFTGTAVNVDKYYHPDDVKPVGNRRRGPRKSLGTLGLESNSQGQCDLEFSTKHNFRLRHTVSNRRLTNYRLRYKGKNITRRRNRTMTLPCNSAATNLQFQAVGRFRNNVQDGIYQDIVTLTVTTQ